MTGPWREIEGLFAQPFLDLLLDAQRVHRLHFTPEHRADEHAAVDQDRRLPGGLRLLSAKRSLRHRAVARGADGGGGGEGKRASAPRRPAPPASAWARPTARPKARDLDVICAMVQEVRALGLESCATLGMLEPEQAQQLKAAGLDYYNHNLDTSAGVLRRDHHHPHLPGPPGHPVRGARCRPEGVLRRYRRHGRIHARSRLDAGDPGGPAAAPGERAHQ